MKAYYIQINDEPAFNRLDDIIGNSKREAKILSKLITKKLGHEVYFVPIFKSKEDAIESMPEKLRCSCGCEAEWTVVEFEVPFNFSF